MAISILVPEKWRRYVNGFLLACLNWFWTLASDLVPPRRAVSFDQTDSYLTSIHSDCVCVRNVHYQFVLQFLSTTHWILVTSS